MFTKEGDVDTATRLFGVVNVDLIDFLGVTSGLVLNDAMFLSPLPP